MKTLDLDCVLSYVRMVTGKGWDDVAGADEETTFRDLGLDSLDVAETALEIEKNENMQIDNGVIYSSSTLSVFLSGIRPVPRRIGT